MTGRRAIGLVVVALVGAGAPACTPAWKQTPHDQLFQYAPPARYIRKPMSTDPSDWWDLGEPTFVRPIGRTLSPGRYVMAAVGAPAAEDVNRLGQVPDSTWFENRIGRRDYTPEEAAAGAAQGVALADGPLRVISGKIDGVSAGFVVRDSTDQIWYLKLDHPAFPELSTGAEVVSSRLLWLAGYRVPAMLTVDIEPSRFVLDPDARTHDDYNRKVALTKANLDQLLANTNPDAHGKLRALISLQPPGEVLGPFSYRGWRRDDVNDRIEHERRRSLRALWLFSAWINNTDTRDANTLDMFRPITADGHGVVEHYLIDFGDAFGASGLGEKAAIEGWEHLLDWGALWTNLFSAGMREPEYANAQRSPFRAVGLFESKVFDPSEWEPRRANPAFDQVTSGDLFWAASILARIQPATIEAAVTAAHYREPGAAAEIVKILLARRAKMLDFGFASYLEVDRPRVVGTELQLDNLRALGGMADPGTIRYTVSWDRTRGFDRALTRGDAEARDMSIVIDLAPALAAARRAGFASDPYLTVRLSRAHGARLEVHLRVDGDRVFPVAVSR